MQRNLNETKVARDRQKSEVGWRSFIAIDLSDEVREAVATVQNELQRSMRDVRWVEPRGIHLTLKFLGTIDPALVETISARTREAIQGVHSFTVTVRGVGGFPNLRKPRVLWVGVQDQRSILQTMKAHIEQRLTGVGFEREARTFCPHLTLGRAKTRQAQGPAGDLIETLKHRYLGDMTIREIILFRSHLKPTGPEYTRLAIIPLQAL